MLRAVLAKLTQLSLVTVLVSGCSTTYVPISWGLKDKVQHLSRADATLAVLFDRYDPKRATLSFSGASFNEVMLPSEVKQHKGAYRPDTGLIYRNLYHDYNDQQLRDLMVHELAHHIWYSSMTREQREDWGVHLEYNPSPLQVMVRSVYRKPEHFPTEDFAFIMTHPRPVDLEELHRINVINEREYGILLSELNSSKYALVDRKEASLPTTGTELSKAVNAVP